MNAYAIIMAGGNGERLWPLSTPERPKQFVSLFGDKPLIRHAADRLDGLIPPERVFVVTAKRLAAMTRKALPHIPKENIIAEPCRRDTAAAVAVACGLVKKHGGDDAVGCVLTADQLMTPEARFRKALKDAIAAAASNDAIVTLGVTPDYPATGFGYIECGGKISSRSGTEFRKVIRFVEKPDVKTAKRYLRTGRFLWNSGMFIWRAGVLEAAFASAAPDIGSLIGKVARSRRVNALLAREYGAIRAISFDYAVMERINGILVGKCDFTWDDVGSWLSVAGHFPKDTAGNVCIGRSVLGDVSGSIVVGSEGRVTALLGVKDVVVVDTGNATLVCDKSRVQDIKKLKGAFLPYCTFCRKRI